MYSRVQEKCLGRYVQGRLTSHVYSLPRITLYTASAPPDILWNLRYIIITYPYTPYSTYLAGTTSFKLVLRVLDNGPNYNTMLY